MTKNKIRYFKVDKLIRDKWPETMEGWGVTLSCRTMDEEEYAQRLKKKLVEEAEEVANASDVKQICEELADVFEVMDCLARANGLTFSDIIAAADKKRAEKGGFDKRIYSDLATLEDGHPNIAYYKAQADKYPEVG